MLIYLLKIRLVISAANLVLESKNNNTRNGIQFFDKEINKMSSIAPIYKGRLDSTMPKTHRSLMPGMLAEIWPEMKLGSAITHFNSLIISM